MICINMSPLPPSDAVRKQKKNIAAFKFSIVKILKISPLWKPEIKLKFAYFSEIYFLQFILR